MKDSQRDRYQLAHFDKSRLLVTVLEKFVLDPRGIHGLAHWSRVRYHGMKIGKERNADLLVVELFAFLHDSCRQDDYADPEHGQRAAEYAAQLHGDHFSIGDRQLEQLIVALEGHSGGIVHEDPTIQTCWDADRLDLVRLNITPRSRYLSATAINHVDRAWKLVASRDRSDFF